MNAISNSTSPRKAAEPWALQDLPPFRPVARKLMLLTAKHNVPLGEIEQTLRIDAAFTADVLRLANSPLTGVRGEIASVLQAVMMLGLERIKALATTLALRTFLTTEVPADALLRCWRHNLATAVVCEWLARPLHLDADTCYTAGLLHDIGQLALLRAFPAKYHEALTMAMLNGWELPLCEKSIFDIDHCQAGKFILDRWQFPQELVEVVALHHAEPQAGESDLLRVVRVGWQMADLLGFSMSTQPASRTIEEIATPLPAVARLQVLSEFGRLADDVALKINAIECCVF